MNLPVKSQSGHTELYVGIQVTSTRIRAGVFNHALDCLGKARLSTKIERGTQELLQRIRRCAMYAVDEADLEWSHISGVGIGIPTLDRQSLDRGMIDNHSSISKSELEQVLSCPVHLEKEGNLAVLACLEKELYSTPSSLLGLFIGGNISAGHLINGEINRTHDANLDNVEHLELHIEGPPCSCGKRGCFHAMASRPAIIHQIQALVATGRQSHVAELAAGRWDTLRSNALRKAAKREDPLTLEILLATAHSIGAAAAHLYSLVQPKTIVMGGRIPELLTEKMRDLIRSKVHQHTDESCNIVFSRLENDTVPAGGAVLVKRNLR